MKAEMKKLKQSKTLSLLLLCVIMALSLVTAGFALKGTAATAASESGAVWGGSGDIAIQFSGGDGTSADTAWEISNGAELAFLSQVINAGNATYNASTVYYKLTADIVLNDTSANGGWENWGTSNSGLNVWTAIGKKTTNCQFTANFDGQGYAVKGVFINNAVNTDDGWWELGLFGYVSAGKISNISVEESFIRGYQYIGGVAGYIGGGSLTNCYNTGSVSGNNNVGGVAGFVKGSTITNCYNTGTVSSMSNYIGGVAGMVNTSGTIINCYNTGAVSGGNNNVGGVTGNVSNSSTVTNCYNTGSVTGASLTGGVAGNVRSGGKVTNCYNTGSVTGALITTGGVTGQEGGGTVANCYFLEGKLTIDGILQIGTNDKAIGVSEGGKTAKFNTSGIITQNGTAVGSDTTSDITGITITENTTTLLDALNAWVTANNSGGEYYSWTGTSFPVLKVPVTFAGGDGTESNPYQISNAEQLALLAEKVNAGEAAYNASGVYYKLTADIVLNDTSANGGWENWGTSNSGLKEWTPIGKKTTNCRFTANFDGQEYAVKGVFINNAVNTDNGWELGLFGYVSAGKISNVSVEESFIRGWSNVGGVAGYVISGGSLANCYNTGAVSGSSSYIGGVAGYVSGGSLTNCYNTGSVSGSNDVGGVAGNISGNMTNCYNTGNVSGSSSYIGGVAGNVSGSLANCYNTGAVSGSSSYIGGVAGYVGGGSLTNCYNTGSVSGSSNVGGVVGYINGGSVTNCYFLTGKITIGITVQTPADEKAINSINGTTTIATAVFNTSGIITSNSGIANITITEKSTTLLSALNAWVTLPANSGGNYNTWYGTPFPTFINSAAKTYEYTITGSGSSFTAEGKNDDGSTYTAGTSGDTIQNVINAIKADAGGQDCTIVFGDGTTELDIGSTSVTFDNTGWGLITLCGKITSLVYGSTSGTIQTSVSLISYADIKNTSWGCAIYSNSTGAITISGGEVSAIDGIAIYNTSTGAITVSGGTVSATSNAIHNASTGAVTVSGGEVSATSGTAIYNFSTGAITVSGGTVSATSGVAIHNASTGVITVSGGEVKATENYGIAIYNESTGKITVSGTATVTSANTTSNSGTIYLAAGTASTDVRLEITGGKVQNTSTGNAIYNNSTGAINISGGTVSTTTGIAIYNRSTGAITISGGEVSSTGSAIYNFASGAITISGGTVSATGTNGRAVNNNSTGEIVLSGSPDITGKLRYAAGKLSVVTTETADKFDPGTKKYSIELSGTIAAGNVAVVGGNDYLSSFTSANLGYGLVAGTDNSGTGGSDNSGDIVLDPYTVAISTTAGALTGGTYNTSGYSVTISASTVSGTIAYSVSAGALPTGLLINTSTGVISGTPSAGGTFTFKIKALNSSNGVMYDEKEFSITIAAINGTGGGVSVSGWEYGVSAETPSVTAVTTGDYTSNTVYYSSDNGSTWIAWNVTAPSNAGTYKIKVVYTATANYNALTVNGEDFTITKKAITRPDDMTGLTYNGVLQNHNVTTNAGYSIAAAATNGALSATNAGTYYVTVTLDSNHEWSTGTDKTEVLTLSWVIAKKALTVSGFNASKEYDGTTAVTGTLALDGVVVPDVVTVSGVYNNANVGTGKALTFTLGGADKDNYTITESYTAAITAKAMSDSDITFPSGYSVAAGSLLSSVSLTSLSTTYGTWAWADSSVTLTTTGSQNLVFTPTDTVNFDWSALTGWNGTAKTITRAVSITVTAPPPTQIDEPTNSVLSAVTFEYNASSRTVTVTSGTGWEVVTASSTLTATNAGSYDIVIRLLSGYAWTDGGTDNVTLTWTITAKAINAGMFNSIAAVIYTGSAQTPAVVKSGTDSGVTFSTNYSNNINKGTASVIITGTGNYSGTVTLNFEITYVAAAPNEDAPDEINDLLDGIFDGYELGNDLPAPEVPDGFSFGGWVDKDGNTVEKIENAEDAKELIPVFGLAEPDVSINENANQDGSKTLTAEHTINSGITYSYQWYVKSGSSNVAPMSFSTMSNLDGWTLMDSATAKILTVSDNGEYMCVVTASAGNLLSSGSKASVIEIIGGSEPDQTSLGWLIAILTIILILEAAFAALCFYLTRKNKKGGVKLASVAPIGVLLAAIAPAGAVPVIIIEAVLIVGLGLWIALMFKQNPQLAVQLKETATAVIGKKSGTVKSKADNKEDIDIFLEQEVEEELEAEDKTLIEQAAVEVLTDTEIAEIKKEAVEIKVISASEPADKPEAITYAEAEEKAANGEIVIDEETKRILQERKAAAKKFAEAKKTGKTAEVPFLAFTLSRDDILDYISDVSAKYAVAPKAVLRAKKNLPDILYCGEWVFGFIYERKNVIKLVLHIEKDDARALMKSYTLKQSQIIKVEGWYDLIADSSFCGKDEVFGIFEDCCSNAVTRHYRKDGQNFVTDIQSAKADADKICALVSENTAIDSAFELCIDEREQALKKLRQLNELSFKISRERMTVFVKSNKDLKDSAIIEREKRYLPVSLKTGGKSYALIYERAYKEATEQGETVKSYVSLTARIPDKYAEWLSLRHPEVRRASFPKSRNWYVITVDGTFPDIQFVYQILKRAKKFVSK